MQIFHENNWNADTNWWWRWVQKGGEFLFDHSLLPRDLPRGFSEISPPLVSRTQSIVVWRMSVPLLCLLQGWSEWHMRVTDKNTALCSGSPRYHNMVLWVLRTQTDTRTRVKMSSQTARGKLLVGSEPTWAPSLYSAFRKEDLSTQLRSDDS